MPEDVQNCPLCVATDHRLFDRRPFRGQLVSNHICRNCGLIFQSPRMVAAELEAFYAQEYRQLYQGEAGPDRKDLTVQAGRADALLHFARGHIPPPARHLDIGCSSGALLRRFQEQYRCLAVGVEPGEAYRAFAQAQGLTVFPSLDELAQQHNQPFELISMAHVLEHLPQPVPYLADLRQGYLAASGWLLLEVPNLYAHHSFEVAHLISFSPHSLREVLRRAGFQVVRLQAHGQPRSVILPLYLTVLARPAMHLDPVEPDQVAPERGVALKRRLGMLRRRLLQRLFPDLAWLPLG